MQLRTNEREGGSMIIDCLENAEKYYELHKDFKKIFRYLSELSEELIPGRAVVRENEVWMEATVVEEKIEEKKISETHQKFLDIHFIVKGEEIFGYQSIQFLSSVNGYDSEKDCELFTGAVQKVLLKKGEFCIVFPEDAHIPMMEKTTEEKLVRVVVKIKI